jgi:hypothetical protein
VRSIALTMTPQQADPMSWILSLNVPFAVMIATAVATPMTVLVIAPSGVDPVMVVVTGLCVAVACLLVFIAARPQKPHIGLLQSIAPVMLSWVAALSSGIAHRDGNLSLEDWTGPFAVSTVIIVLIPYTSAIALAAYGVVGAAICAALAVEFFPNDGASELSRIVSGAAIPLEAGIAGAIFCAFVVRGIARWRSLPYDTVESPNLEDSFPASVRAFGIPTSVGRDVTTLLTRVADEGRVHARDREQAAELARGIRTDLIAVLNRSWFDSLVLAKRLTVVDPDTIANRMTSEQRSTIHALLATVLASPLYSGDSMRIEFRALDDGVTAVALSMDIALPEGRHVMMLAPYFVTLKSSVDKLEWAGGEQLRMRFELPAPPPSPRG